MVGELIDDEVPDAWARWMATDADSFNFELQRGTIEPDRSFSTDAVNRLIDEITLYIGTRIARRWDRTNEPPTALLITVTVDVH